MRVGKACGVAVAMVLAWMVLAWTASVDAQALVVRTLEHGDWARAVAAMQSDPGAQGRVVHVVVEQRLTDRAALRAPCGRYFLLLDAPGQRAFRAGACDPRTAATALHLVDRAALFEVGGVVARPRTIQIAAFEVRQAIAQGQAAQPAGTELRCGVALEPYLVDLLRGVRVRATPERFLLRPIGRGARVEASPTGWVVRAASLRFAYELIDRRTGAVVLRESVAMSCSRGAAQPPEVPSAVARAPAAPAASAITPAGNLPIERTLEPGVSRHAGRCGGERSPEHTYTLEIDRPMWLSLRVESRFDAAVYLRNARGDELDCTVVHGQPGEVRLPRTWAQLAPGTYTIIVDGAGSPPTDGRYRLAMDFLRLR